MAEEKYGLDYITLRGEEIPVKTGYMPHIDLKFYPDNPRIHSLLSILEEDPTQEEIEKILLDREHVKQLIQSIKANGGLTDPIFVHEETLFVLEGNSILAAYRALSKKDPIKWGKIKCKILPEDIGEDKIFSLLGEYHIVGKQDWIPFEQAGYLYRRYKKYGDDPQEMGSSLGLTTHKVNHLIKVYAFMITHKDKDPSRWSYYDEYLKSGKIDKVRNEYHEFDELVVSKIQSGEIPRAADVRDNLTKIVIAGGKTLKAFISGKHNFHECVERAKSGGADKHCYQNIKKFRNWIIDLKVQEELLNLPEALTKKVLYEMKKIKHRIEDLQKRLKREASK